MPDKEHLIAFRDGSYKKIKNPVDWKHSQWIHFALPDGRTVRINPENVNYIEESTISKPDEAPEAQEPE